MNELTSEQKRTFLEWLKDIWDKISGKNKVPAELRHIEKLFGKALTEAGENAKNRENTETKESEQFNISKNGDYSDYDKPITVADVQKLRAIGRKSINKFTDSDIKASPKWAYKFYQELGTKSPFFRAWFGDWRAFDTNIIKTIKVNSIDVQSALNSMLTGTFENDDAGWSISVGALGRNDTYSHSGSAKISVKMLSEIKDIIKNAILLDTEVSIKDSSKKHNETIFMHKLYSPVEYNGNLYIAKVSVEEYGIRSPGKRFYNLRGIKIEPADGIPNANASYDTVSDTSSIHSISDLFNFVKTYDSGFEPHPVNEVLLNDDGTPKVFYHGSGTRFTTFNVNEIAPWEGSFFVAENREDAAAYGKFVMPLYVTGKKLADYDNQPSEFYRLKDKNAQVKWLKERDYDGWYADMDSDGWGEVSVFSPEQIKSAENNIGTFNKYDADTQYSIPEKSSDGQKLTYSQRKFFRDSKVRDEKGRLLAVYHGTTHGAFTVFKDTDDIGYFFTNNKEVTKTYSLSHCCYTPQP